MEAEQPNQGEQPDQNDGSQDAGAQVSQETPAEDSNLTTPQADQPVPSEDERDATPQETQPPADAAVQQDESAGEAPTKPRYDQPEDSGPVSSGDPQDPVQREQELQDERQEHNARTGGGEIQDGEVQAQRDEHNERVATESDAPTEAPAESDGGESSDQ